MGHREILAWPGPNARCHLALSRGSLRSRPRRLGDHWSDRNCWASLGFDSSILSWSPIYLGSAFTDYSLFFVRARICSGPSFFCRSPICTRPLLSVAHRGSPLVAENRSAYVISGCRRATSGPHLFAFTFSPSLDWTR